MIVKDVISLLEDFAPTSYAEDFDNVGLLVGNKNTKVSGVLVTLDTLEAVVEEAIDYHCNLIVSFHPIIFKGLKKITGKTYVERVVMKALKHDIAIYAIHTALDNAEHGVNSILCDTLGLANKQILIPQIGTLKKLTTYVPNDEAEQLRTALFNAGAGQIGDYSECSFNIKGQGTYKGDANSNPTKGEKEILHYEAETQISVVFKKHLESAILKALFATHSYQEVAYEIKPLENTNKTIGMGMLGEFETAMNEKEFLTHLKVKMQTGCIRHSALLNKTIKTVAVLGGSGSFAIEAAKTSGVDAFVTADLKYHDFFAAENSILLADIGHYESERYIKNLIASYLSKKITNFAPALTAGRIILSTTNTNPVKYF